MLFIITRNYVWYKQKMVMCRGQTLTSKQRLCVLVQKRIQYRHWWQPFFLVKQQNSTQHFLDVLNRKNVRNRNERGLLPKSCHKEIPTAPALPPLHPAASPIYISFCSSSGSPYLVIFATSSNSGETCVSLIKIAIHSLPLSLVGSTLREKRKHHILNSLCTPTSIYFTFSRVANAYIYH